MDGKVIEFNDFISGNHSEMKDAGIEWLGKIPKHWSLKDLKYVSHVNRLALSETTAEDYEFNYIDIGNVDLDDGFSLGEKIRFNGAPSRLEGLSRKVIRSFQRFEHI